MKVYVVHKHTRVPFSLPRPTTAQVVKMIEEDLDLYGEALEVDRISSGGRYKFKSIGGPWLEAEQVYTTADAARDAIRQQYQEEIAKLEGKTARLKEKLAGEIVVLEEG
jgi:hypothetical protein